MAQQRVGHSYVFSGLAAIGKKTLALAFTQALNCENAVLQNDSCGECSSCRKMIHGNHPDIHVLETQAQFIRIDAIRNIQEQMTFKPLEGRRRVFLIDDADKMNEQAANALLKTLEEPSADNIHHAGDCPSLLDAANHSFALPTCAHQSARCRNRRAFFD
ncbi:MAG: hypothetical protein MZV70_72620 [Desulfobacterales bacterium]|nr:hypothetical protein [Desulfobacterales bacterium]